MEENVPKIDHHSSGASSPETENTSERIRINEQWEEKLIGKQYLREYIAVIMTGMKDMYIKKAYIIHNLILMYNI